MTKWAVVTLADMCSERSKRIPSQPGRRRAPGGTKMLPEYLKILIPSSVGLLSSVLAAFLSARWAVRRAFAERWWERKERAYTDIIEALYDLVRYSLLCADESQSQGTEHPKREEFSQRYSDAYWKIQKMTDIGPFVISDAASKILKNLRDRPQLEWTENPPWDIYEADCAHYRKALEHIRMCAKSDLKI
jgi:hypothetical protein